MQAPTELPSLGDTLEQNEILKQKPWLNVYRHPTTEGMKGCCQSIASSHALEMVIIAVILVNTIILAVQNPANQFGREHAIMFTAADLILTTIFTIEMFVRIIAMEFLGKRGYLDDAWNRLDFVVVVSSWVNIFVEFFDFDLGIEVSTLRALRILRVLRSLRFFSGIKTILSTIYDALWLATNVVVFICFLFVVCGIIGVQLFNGATRKRCAPGGFEFMESQEEFDPPLESKSYLAPELHDIRPSVMTILVNQTDSEEGGGNMASVLDQHAGTPPLVCADQGFKLSGEYPIGTFAQSQLVWSWSVFLISGQSHYCCKSFSGIGIWHTYCTKHTQCPLFNQTLFDMTGCAEQLCMPAENPGKGMHRCVDAAAAVMRVLAELSIRLTGECSAALTIYFTHGWHCLSTCLACTGGRLPIDSTTSKMVWVLRSLGVLDSSTSSF
eukprot:SAG31_NODE_498_length_14861_cov_3.405026_1_plen_440_part_00